MIAKNIKPLQRLKYFQKVIIPCFGSGEVFAQLIQGVSVQDCQHLFKLIYEVLRNNQSKNVDFSCLELLFYEANKLSVQESSKTYKICSDPTQFKFINELFSLLEMPLPAQLLERCARLISSAFTSFTEDYERYGRQKSVQLMVAQSTKLVDNIKLFESGQKPVLGHLFFMKQMMLATQTQGTGKLRAFNALIPMSLIKIKVYNYLTDYQSDSVKVYQKMVPSNMTLFELLNKLGKAFKRFWHQISLQNHNQNFAFPMKMNGLTLEQLRPHLDQEFYARKNKFFIPTKEPLVEIDGNLNPLFLQTLKQIFAELALKGNMGPHEIKNFIFKVTGSQVDLDDKNGKEMLLMYGSKETGLIDESGFINFYKNSCGTANGTDVVWKNLSQAGYRSDFSKKTEPIKPLREQYMYRYYIKGRPQIYEFLFGLTQKGKQAEQKIARQLLEHLPLLELNAGDQCDKQALSKKLVVDDQDKFGLIYEMIRLKELLDKQTNSKDRQISKSKQPMGRENVVNQQKPQELLKIHHEQPIEQHVSGIIRSNQENTLPIDQEQRPNIARIEIEQDQAITQNTKPLLQPSHFPHQDYAEDSALTQIDDSSQMIDETSLLDSSLIESLLINKTQTLSFVLLIRMKDQFFPQLSLWKSVLLNAIRSLMNFGSLNTNQFQKQNFPVDQMTLILKNIKPPAFEDLFLYIFQTLLQQDLSIDNYTLYEPYLAINLYNDTLKLQQLLMSQMFSHKKFVRIITLNFFVFYSINYQFPINFLQIDTKVSSEHCQQWLNLLQFYIRNKEGLNFQSTLNLLKNRLLKENKGHSQKAKDLLIKGYAKLVHIIFSKNINFIRSNTDQAFDFLTRILHQIVDNSSRLMFYDILYQVNPTKTLKLMHELIKAVKLGSITQEKKATFVGIKNLGSTCYMNSIIQQFFMTESFRKIILNFPIKNIPAATQVNGIQMIDDFLYQFQKMYVALEHSQKKSFYPKEFCLTIKDVENRPINTSIQEDAHEFLNRLFGKIEKYCKDADKLKQLENIFLGKTVCQIICSECQSKLFKIEDFYHLSLEVKGISKLMESFKRFTAPQKIEDYKCETCKKKSTITKQTSLMKLPQILIINLQRIIFDLESLAHVKVHSQLQFPQQIDLDSIMHKDQVMHESQRSKCSLFKLKGVVIHSGTSEGGHYYSIIKFGDDWYRFDDENVSKVGFEDLKELSYGGKTKNLTFDKVHSTNAYILFYEQEKPKGINFGSTETVDSLNNSTQQKQTNFIANSEHQQSEQNRYNSATLESFKSEVTNQNKSFYLESQIHQPSFFEFLNKVYASQRPFETFNDSNNIAFDQEWRLRQSQNFYQELFPIYMKSLKFFAQCFKLPDTVLRDTVIAICELICLLPEKTEDFFRQEVDEKQWTEVICSHEDFRVRELYKLVFKKASFVYCKYFQFNFKPINDNGIATLPKSGQFISTRRFQQIITYFINASSSQLVANNIYKSFFYFDLLRTMVESDERILKLALQSKLLFNILELLMANQSPYAQKDKKRQDLPYDHAFPLVKCVSKLIQFKKNTVGSALFKKQEYSEDNYTELSKQESKILTSVAFYKRMLRLKYDEGSLPLILAFMCYNDKPFSISLSRFFLNCINDLNEVDNIPSLFNVIVSLIKNISTFLRIEDQYQMYRLECILGLPQMYSYNKLNKHVFSYGLGYSSSSKAIRYVSAACFSENDKLKPLLELLYQKRTFMTEFEANGIIALLQLIAPFPPIINYLLSLPPPSYLHVDYLTWIEEYIEKNLPEKGQQSQSHFSMCINKMKELFQIVQKRISQLHDKPQIPVMKQIIGRNKNVESLEIATDEQQNYEIRVYAHETYVLDNIPVKGNTNYSLPDAVFERRYENSYAFYFIEKSLIKNCDIPMKSEKTLISLFISAIKPLQLKFTLPHFTHEIFIPKGQTRINFGYTTEKLDDYLKVRVLEDDQVKEEPRTQAVAANYYIGEYIRERANSVDSVKSVGVNCPGCTYLNKADAFKCEICDSPLS